MRLPWQLHPADRRRTRPDGDRGDQALLDAGNIPPAGDDRTPRRGVIIGIEQNLVCRGRSLPPRRANQQQTQKESPQKISYPPQFWRGVCVTILPIFL